MALCMCPFGTQVYNIDVPAALGSAPPPDGKVAATITITFRGPIGYNKPINLPALRWGILIPTSDSSNAPM